MFVLRSDVPRPPPGTCLTLAIFIRPHTQAVQSGINLPPPTLSLSLSFDYLPSWNRCPQSHSDRNPSRGYLWKSSGSHLRNVFVLPKPLAQPRLRRPLGPHSRSGCLPGIFPAGLPVRCIACCFLRSEDGAPVPRSPVAIPRLQNEGHLGAGRGQSQEPRLAGTQSKL